MNVYDIIEVKNSDINRNYYNGSEKKIGVTINGTDFVMKFRKKGWSNIESEYIASNCIKTLGGDVHDVYLGTYAGERVVLCKDFTNENNKLKSFNIVDSLTLDTDISRHDYYFDEVLYLFNSLNNCDVEGCISKFKEMFVYDALFGNPDRHRGNWGLLKSKQGYVFAPIFDNGATLFPRATNVNITDEWMEERVRVFPNSKIMFSNKRERSSYIEVFKCTDMFNDIVEKITMDKIKLLFTFIETTSIPEYLKTLYKTVVYYRYVCILKQMPFKWEGVK